MGRDAAIKSRCPPLRVSMPKLAVAGRAAFAAVVVEGCCVVMGVSVQPVDVMAIRTNNPRSRSLWLNGAHPEP
jgi:hypothetical protein